MIYTNSQIYFINEQLMNMFSEDDKKSLQLSAKVLFYIEKNKKIFNTLAQEIENTRIEIIDKYKVRENNKTIIQKDKIEIANKELNDLLDIEQDINFYKINIKDLGDVKLTPQQMEALMFMINEPEEEEDVEILL